MSATPILSTSVVGASSVGKRHRRLGSMGTMKRRLGDAREGCVRCTFLFLFFSSLSFSLSLLFFFLVLLVHVPSLSVNVYSLFFPLDCFPHVLFFLSLLVPPLPFKNVLHFTFVPHVFSRSPLSPPFPPSNIWLFDVRLIFDHPFCPIPCYVAKSVMICLLHKLICPFVHFYSYLYLVLSSFYST